jgi:hypothetical protein
MALCMCLRKARYLIFTAAFEHHRIAFMLSLIVSAPLTESITVLKSYEKMMTHILQTTQKQPIRCSTQFAFISGNWNATSVQGAAISIKVFERIKIVQRQLQQWFKPFFTLSGSPIYFCHPRSFPACTSLAKQNKAS